MKTTVNGRLVKGGKVAYDGCHKIYVLESDDDLKEAKELGYDIYGIDKLQEIYDDSCELRFISNWKCNVQYCQQLDNADIKKLI